MAWRGVLLRVAGEVVPARPSISHNFPVGVWVVALVCNLLGIKDLMIMCGDVLTLCAGSGE